MTRHECWSRVLVVAWCSCLIASRLSHVEPCSPPRLHVLGRSRLSMDADGSVLQHSLRCRCRMLFCTSTMFPAMDVKRQGQVRVAQCAYMRTPWRRCSHGSCRRIPLCETCASRPGGCTRPSLASPLSSARLITFVYLHLVDQLRRAQGAT